MVSPGLESQSRLGELISPGRDIIQWQIKFPGRTLAQARLARLGEMSSRSSDPSSPRRDFAQLTGVSFWYFRSGEINSPRRNYQKSSLFCTCKLAQRCLPLNFTHQQFQSSITQTIMQSKHSQLQSTSKWVTELASLTYSWV